MFTPHPPILPVAFSSFPSALTDFDITGQSTPVPILIGSTRQSISIAIIEDAIFEGEENFTLQLTVPGAGPLGITVAMPRVAMVTIVDNECRCTTTPLQCAVWATSVPVPRHVAMAMVMLEAGSYPGSWGLGVMEGVGVVRRGQGWGACLSRLPISDDSLTELDELLLVLVTSPTGQEGVESGEIKPVKFELIITIMTIMVCVCEVCACTSIVSGVLCSFLLPQSSR